MTCITEISVGCGRYLRYGERVVNKRTGQQGTIAAIRRRWNRTSLKVRLGRFRYVVGPAGDWAKPEWVK